MQDIRASILDCDGICKEVSTHADGMPKEIDNHNIPSRCRDFEKEIDALTIVSELTDQTAAEEPLK